VGRSRTGEYRVAQNGPVVRDRDLFRIEDRAARRTRVRRLVGMPRDPRVGYADETAVFLHVRDDQDFRITGKTRLLVHVRRGSAETPGESDLLVDVDVLIAEEQHAVPAQRLVDAAEYVVGETLCKIHAPYFGTEGRAGRDDADGFDGVHARSPATESKAEIGRRKEGSGRRNVHRHPSPITYHAFLFRTCHVLLLHLPLLGHVSRVTSHVSLPKTRRHSSALVCHLNCCGLRPAAWCNWTFTSAGPLNFIAPSSAA